MVTTKEKVKGNEGLKRSLSPINVWALAFGCIIGWGAFVMPGNTFLPTVHTPERNGGGLMRVDGA